MRSVGFWKVVGAQQAKLVRQRLLWVELGLLSILVLIFSALPSLIPALTPGGEPPVTPDLGAELLKATQTAGSSSLGGLLMIILAGAMTAREYEWRTLHLWLSRGVSRQGFLWSMFLVLLGPALLIPATATAAAAPVTVYLIAATHGGVGLSAAALGQVLVSIPMAAFALLPYVGIAIFLAVWGRSQVAAVGGGLAFALVVEGLAVQLLAGAGGVGLAVARHLPTSLGQSLLGGGYVPPVDQAGALALIILYTVVLLAGAGAILKRQDLAQ